VGNNKYMDLLVEKLLKEKSIDYRLIRLDEKAYSVDDVVRNLEGNINLDEICKTIILRGKKTNQKIAILLKGNTRLSFSEVRKFFKEEMAIANEEQVKEASGVEAGAVCPFLLNTKLFVDKKVLNLEKINCGSGNHFYGIEFKIKDLIKGVDYETVSLVKTT